MTSAFDDIDGRRFLFDSPGCELRTESDNVPSLRGSVFDIAAELISLSLKDVDDAVTSGFPEEAAAAAAAVEGGGCLTVSCVLIAICRSSSSFS